MTWWPRGRLPKIGARIYAWTLGWLILCLSDRIIFFHPQPKKLLRLLMVQRKADVIPTGIDPLPFGQRVVSRELRVMSDGIPRLDTQDSRLKTQDCTITYVGRLESVKGVDDFLAASAQLLKEHPDVRIQVAGFYEEGHPLVKEYEQHVSFLGLRDDVSEILAATDIFVLPSYSEGLSNALMEAMASGCACIASDVGGNRFLIQNGVSGLLFPAGDREALRSHLRRLLDDPAKREAMGEAAQKRIEEEFSWDVVGKKYGRLFAGTALC
jgi:glycosyltransferase involved in cell wall biosynthesis